MVAFMKKEKQTHYPLSQLLKLLETKGKKRKKKRTEKYFSPQNCMNHLNTMNKAISNPRCPQ